MSGAIPKQRNPLPSHRRITLMSKNQSQNKPKISVKDSNNDQVMMIFLMDS
mgnify:FL=1